MTYEQKQCILKYFGCYALSIDGIWGPASVEGTKQLQRRCGLKPDGVFGTGTEEKVRQLIGAGAVELPGDNEPVKVQRGDWWDEIEYFSPDEFRCKCGGKYCNGFPAEPHEATVRFADAIRKRIGKPIPVNSGLRCQVWNSIQGGVSNSNHMGGGAVDLGRPSGVTPVQMKAIAEEVMGKTGGIGIYDWGIHIDDGAYSRWDERT